MADATAYSNAHFGHNANIIIALDDLACTTAQSRLIDCTHDSNTGDCSHSDDAGVQCVAREFLLLFALYHEQWQGQIYIIHLQYVHMAVSDLEVVLPV